MEFWSLFIVASMPMLQFLLISLVGAFLASEYCKVLSAEARSNVNKIVFYVFTPSLVFANLAKTVTLHDIISWWFLPVNMGITFLAGGILGWVAVKILRTERHLEGLVIASCSAGNLGYLPMIILPAVCGGNASLFGEPNTCVNRGLSYGSLSLAFGGLFIWTYTYNVMKKASALHETFQRDKDILKVPNCSVSHLNMEAHLLRPEDVEGYNCSDEAGQAKQYQITVSMLSGGETDGKRVHFGDKLQVILQAIAEKLKAPTTIAAILGFIVGVIPWLKSLFIGQTASLRVIEDTMELLGQGTIPCIILILGGTLIQGLQKSGIKPSAVLAIMIVRYVILPAVGILVVKAASRLGFLSQDLLYQYILLQQFAIPPATAIGTMVQLFNIGQQEFSVIFLWTYVVGSLAITSWSTIFMYVLSLN